MSLKHNILANYASQIYTTLIGIFMLPIYIGYMGAEAYGLVGFFAMMQAWFNLLDVGLTPTMARQIARFQGGAIDARLLRRQFRAMEGIFLIVAVIGFGLLALGADMISISWLQVENLPQTEVHNALLLMSLIVALRWTSGLYRGAIGGFEQFVWLGGWNSTIATLRFILVIPYLILVGASSTEFFSFQLCVAILEFVALATKTYRLLPTEKATRTPWEIGSIKGLLRFSLGIAFSSSVWILVTRTDQLFLSKILSLSEYGYFTLAVLAASGVSLIGGALSGAILPRLTKLHAEGSEDSFRRIYHYGTQLIAFIVFPVTAILSAFPEQVLFGWTGNMEIANKAASVLRFYAMGYSLVALVVMPYYLQVAKGVIRLHLYGSLMFLLVLVPTMIAAVLEYGMIGAGWAWFGVNILFFFIWTAIIHARFLPGIHIRWLFGDIFPVLLVSAVGAIITKKVIVMPEERVGVVAMLISLGTLLSVVALPATAYVRIRFRYYVESKQFVCH
jgi:O-antigen/teichoic acid export membrane protein